jgi:hypothetical protein
MPGRERAMRGRSAVAGSGPKRALGWLLLAASGAGCASTTAPQGWLPDPEDTAAFPYGAWVTVERQEEGKTRAVDGELIAVRDSSVIVLADGQWMEIPRSGTKKVKATFYKARLWPLSLWSTVGTVSSLSHGFGLLISAPLWILVGTATTASASKEPEVLFPRVGWEKLRPYARFPQGMPPGMEELPSGP